MHKRAIVTGATGYIGANLVRQLVKQGWQVTIIIKKNDRLDALKGLLSKIKVYEHQGTTTELIRLMRLFKPNYVFHLASLFLARHQPEDIPLLMQANLSFATQVLEAAARNWVKYFINTGTAWQHYRQSEYDPVCLYAATKQAFEDIIKYYLASSKIKVMTLKLFDTYGLNDPRPKIINRLVKALKHDQVLKMSPGRQKLDLVYITDIIRAFLMASKSIIGTRKRYEEYRINSGKAVSLRQLVKLLESIWGKKLKVAYGALPYRPREVMRPWQGGKRLPGWKAKVALCQGLKQIISHE